MAWVHIIRTRVPARVHQVIDMGYYVPPTPESSSLCGRQAIIRFDDRTELVMPAGPLMEGDLIEVIYERYLILGIKWLSFGGVTGFEKVAA